MNWYYVSEGRQAGPVDDAQLEALARSGQIPTDTLVWREGMAQWEPFSSGAPPRMNVSPAPPMAARAGIPAAPLVGNDGVCAECNPIIPLEETTQFGNAR